MQGLAEPHYCSPLVAVDQSETRAHLRGLVPAQPFQQTILRVLRMLYVCFALRIKHISPAIPEEQPIFHLKHL